MNNSLMFIDRFSIFIFLIVSFQYFHSVSLNSFKLEFLVQVIPYFLLIDLFIFPRKIIKLLQNKFLSISLFISFCFLSLLWTGNIKYTLASNLELLLTSTTIIIVVSYIEKNKYGLENITKFSLLAIYFLIFLGISSIDIKSRTILGISPSLSSSIFNYGSVCALLLYHKSNKKIHLFSFITFLFLNIVSSSLRGIFAVLIGSTAYLKIFELKYNFSFYRKILISFLIIAIAFIFIIMNFNITTDIYFGKTYIGDSPFKFIYQFLVNSASLKFTITDLFINRNFDFTIHDYAGERFMAIIIGIKETIINSPIIGFGHGNSGEIYESYGKLTYSHNGITEIFIGTGIIGSFFYFKFLFTQILKPVSKLNSNFIKWKRYTSLVFLVHLMFGLPYENIPLSLMMALIISV